MACELVQIDGSDQAWFEGRGPSCTLLVSIDDATSQLMHLHFTYSESTFSYFDATKRYLQPQAFYSDKASIFRVNRKQVDNEHGVTHFGRVLYQLNIESLCANSSQAKGRVARANLTLQDRLVKELRLEGISTMAAANAHAPSFIADYSRRFAKPPRNDWNAHRSVRQDEDLDLSSRARQHGHRRHHTETETGLGRIVSRIRPLQNWGDYRGTYICLPCFARVAASSASSSSIRRNNVSANATPCRSS